MDHIHPHMVSFMDPT